MTEITINTEQIRQISKEGGKLVLKKGAEDHLERLLELQEYIDEQVDVVKEQIVSSGKQIDENFKGVIGERVSAVLRAYGDKYGYDKSEEESAMPYLNEVKYYRVDSDKVEKYLDEVDELPPGIYEKKRKEKLQIKKTLPKA